MSVPPPNMRVGLPASRRRLGGFTVLEVALAIFIAVGMMTIVLFFYQQAADLRTSLVQESERLTAVRLLMDRLTRELRTARQHSFFTQGFTGGADSIQFIKTEVPPAESWGGSATERVETAQTDLRLVRYAAVAAQNGTNSSISGLTRTEEPLVEARAVASSQVTVMPTDTKPGPEPWRIEVKYVLFRYYDGRSWKESWSGAGLPKGVEINLGFEPVELDPITGDTQGEVFRRVVYLPGSGAQLAGAGGGGAETESTPGEPEPPSPSEGGQP